MVTVKRVLPLLVQKHWDDYFRRIILLENAPGVVDHEFRAGNTLKAICQGRLTVWVVGDGSNIQAVISTYPAGESLAGSRSLIIYSAYGFGNINKETFQVLKDLFLREAREQDCSSILLYTQLPSVAKAGAAMGAKTYYTLTMEVK